MNRRWQGAVLVAAMAVLLPASGCEVNEYCVTCQADDDSGPRRAADAAAGADAARPIADAGPDRDGCSPAGDEQCNGIDDDCDGQVDEAPVAQVGNQCNTDVGPCTVGTFACTDGQLVCEGAVLPSAESCNGVDDDCDGVVDDGNPGGGVRCGSATGECERGLTACIGGQVVCDGEVGPTPELCDTLDNDCDGQLDEGNPEGGAACGNSAGECQSGRVTCIGGTLQCVGGSQPTLEQCDGADNDCDTLIDEDFNFAIDPNHCGNCTTVCSAANAQPACSGGRCGIGFCFTGFHDLNRDPSDGCEYACEVSGQEVCNGLDDDCNGIVDDGLTAPDICNGIGECAGTVAQCTGRFGWFCPYPATVSTDSFGDIIPETDCDGRDNDCDGVADDFFPQLGSSCSRGAGQCETNGRIVCNAAQTGVVCNAATPPAPGVEVCNGLDDNCNGVPDDGAPDAWIRINANLFVYQYEASRPDAAGASSGVMSHRPCSGAGRLPWTNITQPQAEAQCASIGARLCTESEWQTICRSPSGSCTWGFDNNCSSYQPNTCNGNDFDFNPGTGVDDDGLLATGALGQCLADWGGANRVFDMSGNVKEWTRERSPGVNPLRGGSFNNTATGISCGFDFVVAGDTFQFENVGFRCCRSTAP